MLWIGYLERKDDSRASEKLLDNEAEEDLEVSGLMESCDRHEGSWNADLKGGYFCPLNQNV